MELSFQRRGRAIGGDMSVTRERRDSWRESVHAQVLVVDDDGVAATALARLLQRDGHHTAVALDASEARARLAGAGVDVVVCNVRLPGESGLSLAREVARDHPEIGVVMMSGGRDLQTAEAALDSGADSFLAKPFGPDELLIAVSNVLRQRRWRVRSHVDFRMLQDSVNELRTSVSDLHSELGSARRDTLTRLALVAECRVPGMGSHLRRVGAMTAALAQRMRWDPVLCESTGAASTLHDVGKIAVPDIVLLKPGPLTTGERDQMKLHTVIGHQMLAASGDPLLDTAATIALSHHERLDGSGYPQGLSGTAIPIEGRMVAIVDVFDALIGDRPYRAALTVDLR